MHSDITVIHSGVLRFIKYFLLIGIGTFPMLFSLSVFAWSTLLLNGSQVKVDPQTRQATIIKDGSPSQLWDGVHRLDNGSIITVRSGRVVPNAALMEIPTDTQQTDLIQNSISPCEVLVHRVCGYQQQCKNSRACSPALQLLSMEHEERLTIAAENRISKTGMLCIEAERDDEYFATCTTHLGRELSHPNSR